MNALNKQRSPKQDWLILEELVASIQKKLAPAASVEHNVHIKGRITQVDRQVDVLVTQLIGQYKMTIVIDCKDTKRPVDTKGVEEFSGLVNDIGANKGVLVCPAGFTKAALRTAKSHQIELYRPVDTGNHKWKIRASAPATCDFRSAAISIGFQYTALLPLTLTKHVAHLDVFDATGKSLGTPLAVATAKWNAGKLPLEPGEHERHSIFDDSNTFVDNGYGTRVQVKLFIDYHVNQRMYFGQIPIEKISGFLDEYTGLVTANSFTLGLLSPSEVENSWRKLAPDESPPVAPLFGLVGLDCWPE
ncbi:MAG: restriction endonuclease [Sideroxydans sp.]|nr:restriction endonuclease [Sideroxydans sp.]